MPSDVLISGSGLEATPATTGNVERGSCSRRRPRQKNQLAQLFVGPQILSQWRRLHGVIGNAPVIDKSPGAHHGRYNLHQLTTAPMALRRPWLPSAKEGLCHSIAP